MQRGTVHRSRNNKNYCASSMGCTLDQRATYMSMIYTYMAKNTDWFLRR